MAWIFISFSRSHLLSISVEKHSYGRWAFTADPPSVTIPDPFSKFPLELYTVGAAPSLKVDMGEPTYVASVVMEFPEDDGILADLQNHFAGVEIRTAEGGDVAFDQMAKCGETIAQRGEEGALRTPVHRQHCAFPYTKARFVEIKKPTADGTTPIFAVLNIHIWEMTYFRKSWT